LRRRTPAPRQQHPPVGGPPVLPFRRWEQEHPRSGGRGRLCRHRDRRLEQRHPPAPALVRELVPACGTPIHRQHIAPPARADRGGCRQGQELKARGRDRERLPTPSLPEPGAPVLRQAVPGGQHGTGRRLPPEQALRRHRRRSTPPNCASGSPFGSRTLSLRRPSGLARSAESGLSGTSLPESTWR